ncbi:MAG: DinB family protein [Pirellulales bacterium]
MPEVGQWELAKERILFTQKLVGDFLEGVDKDDWFRMPTEGVTHVAWQVGHLSLANFGLGITKQRELGAEDAGILPKSFSKLFGKGSTPSADASVYPTAEEIHAVYKRVDAHVAKSIQQYDIDGLDEKLEPPHPLFDAKFKALVFMPQHHMMHFGQIALLRRLFGNSPVF